MTAPMPGPPAAPATTAAPVPAIPAVTAAVAAAMAGLDHLDERPLAEHVTAFERVHAALGDALAAGSTG
ncbi:hypothetical protein [Pseudonocardia sp.]|uniref:hypothetical protein n=1 Tax=Pseudonocardia sp. TaxID=60912 RepID=UPI003D099750